MTKKAAAVSAWEVSHRKTVIGPLLLREAVAFGGDVIKLASKVEKRGKTWYTPSPEWEEFCRNVKQLQEKVHFWKGQESNRAGMQFDNSLGEKLGALHIRLETERKLLKRSYRKRWFNSTKLSFPPELGNELQNVITSFVISEIAEFPDHLKHSHGKLGVTIDEMLHNLNQEKLRLEASLEKSRRELRIQEESIWNLETEGEDLYQKALQFNKAFTWGNQQNIDVTPEIPEPTPAMSWWTILEPVLSLCCPAHRELDKTPKILTQEKLEKLEQLQTEIVTQEESISRIEAEREEISMLRAEAEKKTSGDRRVSNK